jgi:hypothetical protein
MAVQYQMYTTSVGRFGTSLLSPDGSGNPSMAHEFRASLQWPLHPNRFGLDAVP